MFVIIAHSFFSAVVMISQINWNILSKWGSKLQLSLCPGLTMQTIHENSLDRELNKLTRRCCLRLLVAAVKQWDVCRCCWAFGGLMHVLVSVCLSAICMYSDLERDREPVSVDTYQREQSPKTHKYSHANVYWFTVDLCRLVVFPSHCLDFLWK